MALKFDKQCFSSEGREGIRVSYRKWDRMLFVGGWYDSMVGIPDEPIRLGRFLTALGITAKDCEKALKEEL